MTAIQELSFLVITRLPTLNGGSLSSFLNVNLDGGQKHEIFRKKKVSFWKYLCGGG